MSETIVLWVIGGVCTLFFALLGIVWARVESLHTKLDDFKDALEVVKDHVAEQVDKAMDEIHRLMEREKKESVIADKRLNMHDRISSAITDKPFDSKLIATGSGEIPSTTRIQKLMGSERTGNA